MNMEDVTGRDAASSQGAMLSTRATRQYTPAASGETAVAQLEDRSRKVEVKGVT